MKSKVDMEGAFWTYGAEHELADWDTHIALPTGYGRADDWTLVNTNGIAVQPNPKVYRYGGEINTPPTKSPRKQADCIEEIISRYPNCAVNHRSNLHIHVRVPGLGSSLPMLKRVQKCIHDEFRSVINLIEPIPKGETLAERKREKRRKISHHMLLKEKRVNNQLAAKTVREFFEREVPVSKTGQVMWHAQPRLAVNIRQILQTDTIEFRHFPGTLDSDILYTCITWCRDFLLAALHEESIIALYKSKYKNKTFPKFPKFSEQREIRYQATASHGALKRAEIEYNIQLILKGKFHGSEAEKEATMRARGLSR